MRRSTYLTGGLSTFALLVATSAWAADTASTSANDRNAVSEVLVAAKRNISDATHLDAAVQDLPIAIQTVPIQLIEDQGFQRLGDAIRNVSGVVRKEAYMGVTDSFGIRGFDARTGLFNGFRHDFYDTTLDLAHVERLEVIKGPGSVSSGYLEPGGVVSLVTKSPTAEPITALDLTVGGYAKYRAQGDVSRALSDTVRVRLTGAWDQSNSFRDTIHAKKWTLGGALDWDLGPDTTLALRAYTLHIEQTPDRGFDPDSLGEKLFQLPRSRYLGEPTDNYQANSNDYSAVLNHDFGGGWSVRAGVEENRYADHREATQTTDLAADGRTVGRQFTLVPSTNKIGNAFAEVHGTFDTGGLQHRLIAGLEANRVNSWYDFRRYGTVASIDIYNPVYAGPAAGQPPSIGASRTITEDVGVYAQDLISLGDQWKLLVGLRRDQFENRAHDLGRGGVTRFKQSKTTPRVGVIFEPSKAITLYANYARSFNPQAGTTLKSGQTPAPEQGEQYEAGIKYRSDDGRLIASAAAYQIKKTNIATADPSDPDFSILAGAERSRGVEFDLSAKPTDTVQIVAGYAHTNAVVTRDEVLPIGDHLLNAPPNQASLWTRYDPKDFPIGVGLGLFYVGKREAYLPNTFKVPDYVRVDGAIYWPIRDRVDLAINVQNLTNKKYYDSQNSYLYPGAPRSVLATLRLKY